MLLNGHDKLYYILHKYVLTSIGLWPYQSRITKRFFFITYGISSCSLILALIAGLFEKWSTNPVIILENMLGIIFVTSSTAESSILYMQENKIIEFYDKIKTDWEKLTDKKEIEILQTHTRKGQYVSIAYVLYGVPAFAIFGFITFLPPILDPTSRMEYSHLFPYYFYCMIINEDFRYYQMVLHCIVSFSYAGVSYLAVNCTFVNCVNHVCGLCAIICYRLKNVIEPATVKRPFNKLKNKKSIRFNLIGVIAKHREVIHGVDMIEQIFSTGFLVIEIAAFSGIALVIADILYNQKNAYQLFRITVVTAIFLVYIFYINWMGEQIIQVSDDVRLTAYFIDWFTLSVEAQEIIHMIVRRSCKTNKLTAGSFVALSLENFLSILKTSWSAATVVLSAQRSQRHTHFTGYGITNPLTNSSSI